MESTILNLSARLPPYSASTTGVAGSGNSRRKQTLRLPHNHTREGECLCSALNGDSSFLSSAGAGGSGRQMRIAAGWFLGIGGKKDAALPEIVKVGDPVLHEPARDVEPGEIGSERIDKIIEDMIQVMRRAPGVGLAAPQIGVPLRIVVMEDTQEYISYADRKEVAAQDRRPFELLVILNPVLKKKGDRTALFFEGCLSVDGYRAVVERHLEVEVSGVDRQGRPMRVEARGWQARILQHECDHLDGTIYVDRMLPRTFRTVDNLPLPLPAGCPQLGPR